jgi:hypothetical protein
MTTPDADTRSAIRRAQDEQIAAETKLPPLPVAPGTAPLPVEAHLHRFRRPLAVAGVVENGVVRPLDPAVKLTEHARVIIVASEET